MTTGLTRLRAALLLLAIITLSLLALSQWPDNFLTNTLEQLRNFQTEGAILRTRILAFGGLAPAIFVLIQVAQVVVAPIPGEASGFLGGYLFGAWFGFLYSSLGLTTGSALAFGGGRLLTAFFTERFRHTSFYRRFNHLVCRGDFLIPFVLFLLPGFPKDSLCYLLGMSSMPWTAFLLIAGVGADARHPDALPARRRGLRGQLAAVGGHHLSLTGGGPPLPARPPSLTSPVQPPPRRTAIFRGFRP